MSCKELEIKLIDLLDDYFPKGLHRDRGKALVLIAVAREAGVQGAYEKIKEKKNA